jgi:hypothetical protein
MEIKQTFSLLYIDDYFWNFYTLLVYLQEIIIFVFVCFQYQFFVCGILVQLYVTDLVT